MGGILFLETQELSSPSDYLHRASRSVRSKVIVVFDV
jgi:hypothetical protein